MIENRRSLEGVSALLAQLLAALLPLSALVYALRILPDLGIIIYRQQYLALFLTLCLVWTFLAVPPRAAGAGERHVPWYDLILAAAAGAAGGYVALRYHVLVREIGLITPDKVLVSIVSIVLLLEAVRRHAGWVMVGVGAVALGYAYFGHLLSGPFETRVLRFDRLMMYNYLGDGAILGVPLAVAATIITAFILFGQMLFRVGGGQAISDFAFALMGRRRGGPAKVAVLASALFGSLSGSASANVATTGTLTIPMMKQVGYAPREAAAIEAVASTGGLILPPVMAATGFIMAEFLAIPYASVALAAALPALLFYLCVYLQVDLEAGRRGLIGWPGDELPALRPAALAVAPVLLPFAVLLYVLFVMLWSPEAAAFIATGATVAVSLLVPRMRRALGGYLTVLAGAGEAVVFIAMMCAIAGLVVGVLGLTGLGTNLSQNLVQLAGGNVWLLLVFAAIGCIVLGMGVPVTATYIILVILIGPALVQTGVPELAAHMFVFYFGTLSFLTPPVCLSVFVAASLAKSDPIPTAFTSMRLAVIAYVVPFAFVFNDAFLLHGDWEAIANAAAGAVVGVFLLSAGLVGYFLGRLGLLSRLVAVATGLGAITWGAASWLLCAAALGATAGLYLWQRRQAPLTPAAAPRASE